MGHSDPSVDYYGATWYYAPWTPCGSADAGTSVPVGGGRCGLERGYSTLQLGLVYVPVYPSDSVARFDGSADPDDRGSVLDVYTSEARGC